MNRAEKISQMLNEGKFDDVVDKGLYTAEGKKVNLERMATVALHGRRGDDTLVALNWKEYVSLKVPTTSSDHAESQFVQLLAKKLTNFGRQVDFNSFAKKGNPSFEDKVTWLLKNGVKYTKKGLKK